MKKILALGGAVMKTPARDLLWEVVGDMEMVVLNGASLFHDFQWACEGFTSIPLDELINDRKRIQQSSLIVADWLYGGTAPTGSFTAECEMRAIPILLFTAPGTDFWHHFMAIEDWRKLGERAFRGFHTLHNRFVCDPFHFVCMGSAVLFPEVFIKALKGVPQQYIRADVVDFLDMYRPRTRIAERYGKWFGMSHEEFLKDWLSAKKRLENGYLENEGIWKEFIDGKPKTTV